MDTMVRDFRATASAFRRFEDLGGACRGPCWRTVRPNGIYGCGSRAERRTVRGPHSVAEEIANAMKNCLPRIESVFRD